MLQKNKKYHTVIIDLSADGLGIGKVDGMIVFVTNAVVGDELIVHIVKVCKTYAYGIIFEIITPSPDRIESVCEVAAKCGGCSLQAMTYEAECRFKWKRVADCVKRIGKLDCPVSPLIPAEQIFHYRNKAQYPIAEQNGQVVSGFYAPRSHRVIPSRHCHLQPPVFSKILEAFLQFLREYSIPIYQREQQKGMIRHLYLRQSSMNQSVLVCIVSATRKLPYETELVNYLTGQFSEIVGIVVNYHPEDTNVILGDTDRVVYGTSNLTDLLAGVRLTLSHHSFYQVNHPQAEKLYQIAKKFALTASSKKVLLDLYCGVGSIGLSMADSFDKVIGIEVVPQAIENAKYNAKINDIDTAEFYCIDASDAVRQFQEKGIAPDVILLDPPRKGCAPDVIDSIAQMEPECIVMVSCNPATCARDLATLAGYDYRVREIIPVDLFPRSCHVETVCLLSKKEKQTTEGC